MSAKRKRPSRIVPTSFDGLDSLYDYCQPDVRRQHVRKTRADEPIVVTDDWPDVVPITEAELRVMEAFFKKELDELFGPLP